MSERTALSPLVCPTVVGNYTAAQNGLVISTEVQCSLSAAALATTRVAIFACADSSITSGSITGTFSAADPTTWPNGGKGVRYLGIVSGGVTTPGSATPNTLLNVNEDPVPAWEPCYIALRVLGTAAVSLFVSGIGDPTGTGGTAWLVGGQVVSDDPGILGPSNGAALLIQAGGLPMISSDGTTLLIISLNSLAIMRSTPTSTSLYAGGAAFISYDGTTTIVGGYSLPTTDGSAGQFLSTNGAGVTTWGSSRKASFGATLGLVTASAQYVPICGPLTTLAAQQGQLIERAATVSKIFYNLTGDAANVAGQTLTVSLLKNGVAISGATMASIATTAGVKSGNTTFSPVSIAEGDILTCTILPSALLTAAYTLATVVVR